MTFLLSGNEFEIECVESMEAMEPRNIAAEQNAEIENWKRDVMLEIFTMRRNLTNLENQVRNHPF